MTFLSYPYIIGIVTIWLQEFLTPVSD